MTIRGTLPLVWPLVLLAGTGCVADREMTERLVEQQDQHSQMLAEQNAMVEAQWTLLAELIDTQQEMVETLAGINRLVKENHERARERAAQQNGDDAVAAFEPAIVVSEEGKAVLGRNEWAWLELLQRNLKARIDTGALSSSLSAIELQPFERDGQRWIRFRVPDEEHPDGGEVYETPLLRHVRIRQASAGELERRPVVQLKVRVGELADETEFTLTNRENMLYPVLLGRNFLRDVALVDVARKFVQQKYVVDAEAGE